MFLQASYSLHGCDRSFVTWSLRARHGASGVTPFSKLARTVAWAALPARIPQDWARTELITMSEPQHHKVSVGIDVSKATLDIAVHEPNEVWSTSNDSAGGAELVTKLKKLK